MSPWTGRRALPLLAPWKEGAPPGSTFLSAARVPRVQRKRGWLRGPWGCWGWGWHPAPSLSSYNDRLPRGAGHGGRVLRQAPLSP